MMMRRTLLTATVLSLLSLAVGSATAQDTRRVLFVGNSYTSVNNLPSMVAAVAASMGDSLDYSENTPGGCTFMQHCTNRSMTLIREGGWDAVVLQEQSQYPSFPQQQVEQEVFPYAARLVDSVYAASPCAEPMFYMTWGRKNGDAQNAQVFPILGTYEGMDTMLYTRYMYMAHANDASVCPVGRVWRRLRAESPDIELYQSDESHPSLAGSYAAACSFYVMLFGGDPMRIDYSAGLDERVATRIRETVCAVVYEQLDQWKRPRPEAVPETVSVDGLTVSFVDRSQHVDSTVWDFGDGTVWTPPAGVDEFDHHYGTSGDYTVTVVGGRRCMNDTATVHLALSQGGTEGIGTGEATAEVRSVTVYGIDGRLLRRGSREEAALLSGLPTGVYLLRIETTAGTIVKKTLKR